MGLCSTIAEIIAMFDSSNLFLYIWFLSSSCCITSNSFSNFSASISNFALSSSSASSLIFWFFFYPSFILLLGFSANIQFQAVYCHPRLLLSLTFSSSHTEVNFISLKHYSALSTRNSLLSYDNLHQELDHHSGNHLESLSTLTQTLSECWELMAEIEVLLDGKSFIW